MNNEEYENEFKNFINVWGWEAQTIMCIEEMSELTKALTKYIRLEKFDGSEDKRRENIDSIREELADVSLMIGQIQYMLGFTEQEIDEIRKAKIQRTVTKLRGKGPKSK